MQEAATAVVDRTRTLFYVDTLEYLRRGGRIGTAAALLATSLSVKPLLQMVEGQIVALEKVRTPTRALARLVSLTADAAGPGPVDIAVHHLAAAARAERSPRSCGSRCRRSASCMSPSSARCSAPTSARA